MSNVDEGYAQFLVHLLEFYLHVLAHLAVEGGEGLVEQQHLGLVHQGARDGHPLLLAAGQGVHVAVFVVRHSHHLEHLAHAAVDLVGGNLLQLEAEGDVVVHVQMGEEGVALEHGVQRPLVGGHARYVLAVQQDLAFVGLDEACYEAQRGGFAAARGAQQGDEFAFPYIKVDVVQYGFAVVTLGYALQVQDVMLACCHFICCLN